MAVKVLVVVALIGVGIWAVAKASHHHEPRPASTDSSGLMSYLRTSHEKYASVNNEVQRSEIFRATRKYERDAFDSVDNALVGWEGRLDYFSTNKGGEKVRATITIPGAADDSFRMTFHSVVPRSRKAYAAFADLSEGQCVLIGGWVDPDESSVTESGAMANPEHDFQLMEIHPCPEETAALATTSAPEISFTDLCDHILRLEPKAQDADSQAVFGLTCVVGMPLQKIAYGDVFPLWADCLMKASTYAEQKGCMKKYPQPAHP